MSQVHVLSHPDCLAHETGLGHPETPERLRRVLDTLRELPDEQCVVHDSAPLPPEDDILGTLSWIHDSAYLDRVRDACAIAPTTVDGNDCAVSPGSWRALTAAAGLCLQGALDLASGRFVRAFIAARPPSHHAERRRARGYCFFNGTALAADTLARAGGSSVLVVDFDAHHGNGTQLHFWERGDVGYVSVHEHPAFPGSGGADEIGSGKGRGATRNVPLASGADDDVWATALENALEEVGSRLRPACLVVSAGFSAHTADPISGMQVTEDGFRRMTKAIVQASEAWSHGMVLSVLEGGFDVRSLAASSAAHVCELARESSVN